MKTKLLTLFSLLALLLVSTAILADGRPTGIRIGRAVSGGNMNAEIDLTITGTDYYYTAWATSYVWVDNRPGWDNPGIWQYASDNFSIKLPRAVDWGDGFYLDSVMVFGAFGGPYRGTFAHTYTAPGTYTVSVGDFVCDSDCKTFDGPPNVNTGNPIYGLRYISATFDYDSFTETSPVMLAITATAVLNTGTGIPALNVYGLLAMAFVLVGSGVLVFRKPQQA